MDAAVDDKRYRNLFAVGFFALPVMLLTGFAGLTWYRSKREKRKEQKRLDDLGTFSGDEYYEIIKISDNQRRRDLNYTE